MEFFTDIFIGLIVMGIMAAVIFGLLWCAQFSLLPYVGGGFLVFFIAWAIGVGTRHV